MDGDRVAQHQLYQRYAHAMYHTCLRLLKHQEDAEDVMQTAFIDVFSKLRTFRQESTLGAWIKRIVINHCLSYIKQSKRMVIVPMDNYEMPIADHATEVIPNHLLEVKKVKKAMKDLPQGYRTISSLYLFEGYDHEEIAQIMNISVSTSKSQLHRAKIKLRQLLSDKETNNG